MVKYCPGNFCKKKKRKFTWIYNRYPGAPRTKVTDPNNVIVSNAPNKMDTSAAGIADYWLSYLPPYRVGKDLIQGLAAGDAGRVAKNLAGQAFTTATVLAPYTRVGSVAASFLRNPISNVRWLARNVGPQQASEIMQGYVRGVFKPLRNWKLNTTPRFSSNTSSLTGYIQNRNRVPNVPTGTRLSKSAARNMSAGFMSPGLPVTGSTYVPGVPSKFSISSPATPKLNRVIEAVSKGENVFIRSPMGGHIRPPGRKPNLSSTGTPIKSRASRSYGL